MKARDRKRSSTILRGHRESLYSSADGQELFGEGMALSLQASLQTWLAPEPRAHSKSAPGTREPFAVEQRKKARRR
jgi:hypothetical protein